jgi:hypothetical protein
MEGEGAIEIGSRVFYVDSMERDYPIIETKVTGIVHRIKPGGFFKKTDYLLATGKKRSRSSLFSMLSHAAKQRLEIKESND